MATTNKHPPLDPNRHSTNKRVTPGTETARSVSEVTAKGSKRVKPLGENIFGTPYLTAEGSKRVKPGEPNTTGSKQQGPAETARQRWDREAEEKAREVEARRQLRESYLSEARAKLLKKGWFQPDEALILQRHKGLTNKT